jgi:hypothetical protein
VCVALLLYLWLHVCVTVLLYMYSLVCLTVLARVHHCTRSCVWLYSPSDCTRSCVRLYSLVCATVLARLRECTRSCAPLYSLVCMTILARLCECTRSFAPLYLCDVLWCRLASYDKCSIRAKHPCELRSLRKGSVHMHGRPAHAYLLPHALRSVSHVPVLQRGPAYSLARDAGFVFFAKVFFA